MVGLIGIDTSGRLAWENGVARSLLGGASSQDPRSSPATAESLGIDWAQLAALPTAGAAPLALPNGLHVWARAEMLAPDGRRGLVAHGYRSTEVPAPNTATAAHTETSTDTAEATDPPAATPPVPAPQRLRESDLELIRSTLRDCGGNVSDAAQRLGVSRGLIYRRLRASRAASPEADT
jgi:hypothetical protein